MNDIADLWSLIGQVELKGKYNRDFDVNIYCNELIEILNRQGRRTTFHKGKIAFYYPSLLWRYSISWISSGEIIPVYKNNRLHVHYRVKFLFLFLLLLMLWVALTVNVFGEYESTTAFINVFFLTVITISVYFLTAFSTVFIFRGLLKNVLEIR